MAQNVEISGRVADDKGNPVSGASIQEKNSKRGTTSDANGLFKLSVKPGTALVISSIGFDKKQVVADKSGTLAVVLTATNLALSEVVVTALGIKREKKALGYSVTTVASKDIELRPEGDIGRVLNGKVAGLNVLNSSGISGSGTNINIRGISTITGGASTPLFIVDGVPFDGGNNGGDNFQYGGGTSSSSRFLDLDPNNIESVNVLKGLSATTLYGEAARNGVILVTTKNGSTRKLPKKMEITASQSVFTNTIANLPDYQDSYGGGFDLVPSAAFSNWGAKFTNPPLQVAYSPSLQAAYPALYGAGKTQDYRAYDNVKPFFRTGVVKTSSINVAASSATSNFNANYSYMDDQGFTPNNRVFKNNFGIGGTSKLSNNFTLSAVLNFAITDFQTPIVGGDLRQDNYKQTGLKSTQQIVYGLFDHSNFITHDIYSEGGADLDYKVQKTRAGIYASANIGYKEFAFVTLNGRNDYVSTLEKDNRQLFYPGVSASFIPTAAFAALKNSNTINYLKLRLGYSTSAHFPDPYNTRPSLSLATNAFVDKNGNIVNIAAVPNRVPNPGLKPELLKETEAGIEGSFFNRRLTADITGYFRTASNQILDRQLDASTGYNITAINAGAVDNKGIEIALGYTVVSSKDWKWQLDGVYTINKSKVHDMPDDIKSIQTGGYSNLGTFAINGQPLGVLQGSYVQTDPKTGQKIVDANGYFLGSSDIGIIADPNPNYRVTGISTLSYKSFSFRMQWDYSQGGQMFSNTVRTMLSRGTTKDTDFDRTLPFIIPNTVKQDGTPNDIQQSVDNIYFNAYGFGPASVTVWDATVIRLRELSVSYSIPQKLLKKLPFGSASLSVSGNNLWYSAPNFPKYTRFDPESNSLGVGNARGLDLFAGPSSRRIGASLRLTF
ncbi:TonB-dependent receptor plug domain protein [Ostertagia ostertagi]